MASQGQDRVSSIHIWIAAACRVAQGAAAGAGWRGCAGGAASIGPCAIDEYPDFSLPAHAFTPGALPVLELGF